MQRLPTFRLLALLAISWSGVAHAHDPGMSAAQVQLEPGRAAIRWVVENGDLSERRRTQTARCDGALSVRETGGALRCRRTVVDAQHTAFEAEVARAQGGQIEILLPLLAELPRGHRAFARVVDAGGRVVASRMLSSDEPRLPVALPALDRSRSI